jgi:DNA helicase-2/ATP-dependent DNA helicase PcrA
MELPRQEMQLSDSYNSRRTTPDWDEAYQGEAADEFPDADIDFDPATFDADDTNPKRQRGTDTNPKRQRGSGSDTNPKRQRGTGVIDDISADEFSQLDEPMPKRPAKAKPALTSGLVTGADLLAKDSRPRTPAAAFKHGMVVSHPQYGAGTIVALSGEGVKRNAVVRFFADEAERTFRLAFSDLTPAE